MVLTYYILFLLIVAEGKYFLTKEVKIICNLFSETFLRNIIGNRLLNYLLICGIISSVTPDMVKSSVTI